MTAAREHYLLFCSSGLGDSLFCTPAMRFLRQQRPAALITVVVKEKLQNLFATNPRLSGLITYRNHVFSKLWAAWRVRRAGPYRAIFFFHVGGEVVRLIQGARYERLHCVQALAGLPPAAKLFPIDIVNRRQWEDFADMVALECGGRNENHEFELPVASESAAAARASFEPFRPVSGPRIGLQLGGSHLGKCWPPQRYAAVADHLLRTRGGTVFFNATARETPLRDQFLAALPPGARDRCHALPQTSINGFAGLVRELDLLITNDTGPLHVALSQNTPVVALKAHDDQTYPYTLPRATPWRRSLFIRTDVPTSGKAYQQSHRAMECIPMEAVIREAEAVLAEPPPPRH